MKSIDSFFRSWLQIVANKLQGSTIAPNTIFGSIFQMFTIQFGNAILAGGIAPALQADFEKLRVNLFLRLIVNDRNRTQIRTNHGMDERN